MKKYAFIFAAMIALTGCERNDGVGGTDDTESGTGTVAPADTNATTGSRTPTTGSRAPSGTDRGAVGTDSGNQPPTLPSGSQAGAQMSDEQLKTRIEASLRGGALATLDTSGIEVVIDEGQVTLRGRAPNESAKQMIEQAVRQMPGVKSVQNELEVSQGTATQPNQ